MSKSNKRSNKSVAWSSKNYGDAISIGESSIAAWVGDKSGAAYATGDFSVAITTGDSAYAEASGKYSQALNTGGGYSHVMQSESFAISL